MISYKNVKAYCCEDITTIENYEKAVMDPDIKWVCHHRKEIDEGLSMNELIDRLLYYMRPASELIFLTPSEHFILHKKNKIPWNKGKKLPPLLEETKQKISEKMKGGNSTSFKKKQIPWNKGKKIDTSKYKNYGKHREYHRAPNAREIICVETGKIYSSIDEAAKDNNLKSHCGINLCCQGKQKTAGGYHWEYNK